MFRAKICGLNLNPASKTYPFAGLAVDVDGAVLGFVCVVALDGPAAGGEASGAVEVVPTVAGDAAVGCDAEGWAVGQSAGLGRQPAPRSAAATTVKIIRDIPRMICASHHPVYDSIGLKEPMYPKS